MPKTEVILTHNVVGLGAESDQVKVAAGFARNYLFPQRLAIPLTMANKKQIQALQKRRVDREAKDLHSMSELASTLSKLTLIVKVKTGEDGKMFGSVTAGTIADELHAQYEAHLDKRKIHLQHPIKTLGEHEVPLHLHHDVNCNLKVRVESATPLSPEAQAALAAQNSPANNREDTRSRDGGRGGRGDRADARAPKAEARPAEAKDGKKSERPEKTEKTERPEKKAKTKAA